LVKANNETAIQSALAEQQAAANRIPTIDKEITEIGTRIAETKKRRSLEAARSRRQLAADALSVALEEALFAEAGTLLLEQVKAEHVRASQPAVLLRAEDWFARFTRHQFELEFQPEEGGTFAARETATQERRNLAQLSSGTRMQLLLAVRVAFALEAERGRERLPLFLDEALTTADPERFQAAAESLARLADEQQRQIIYLTAQPGDIAFWQASGSDPTCIDLMECRRSGRAIAGPGAIALPPAAPEPPKPGSMSAEDYAVAIGVSPIAPWGPTAGIHLFHILREDLELLWQLLRAGIDRIGPLESLLGSAEVDLVLAAGDQRRLRRRIAGTEAWIEAWRQGRGRPVDREVLEASEAVSGAFIDRVAALAQELDGDGRRLVERLKGGGIDRFRSRSAEALEQWLSENGYVDATEPLDPASLERRTASAMALHFDDAEDGKAEARELARFLAAGVTAASALKRSKGEPELPGRR
jgi:hypothetical protein